MTDREPCPYRIIDDVGNAFMFGAGCSGVFNFFKGAHNAPKGSRWSGAMTAIKARSPVLGGNFAVWGALYAVGDCSLVAIRHKEDPWNSIMSGFMTGGVLALRAGPKTAFKNAVIAGVLLALIEGAVIATSKYFAQPQMLEDGMGQGQGLESGAPKRGPTRASLEPPIRMPTASSSVRARQGREGDYDSSAYRQADVTTDKGFDTDTKFADSQASADAYAGLIADPALGNSKSLSPPTAKSSWTGWVGGLFGKGK